MAKWSDLFIRCVRLLFGWAWDRVSCMQCVLCKLICLFMAHIRHGPPIGSNDLKLAKGCNLCIIYNIANYSTLIPIDFVCRSFSEWIIICNVFLNDFKNGYFALMIIYCVLWLHTQNLDVKCTPGIFACAHAMSVQSVCSSRKICIWIWCDCYCSPVALFIGRMLLCTIK